MGLNSKSIRMLFILTLLLTYTGCGTDSLDTAAFSNKPAQTYTERETDTVPGGFESYDEPLLSDSEGKPVINKTDSNDINSPAFDAVPANEISVAVLGDNEFLNLAARLYEEAEGVKVNIVYYNDEADTAARFSQIIYTALMSGGGDDIIDMSMLTWDKAGDRGKLADLNEYLVFPPDEYYINILDAFLRSGKRYVIPLNFSIGAYLFTDGYTDKESPHDITPEDLFDLAAKYPDAQLFDVGSGLFRPPALMWRLFNVYSGEFINTENNRPNINSEKFISLLETIKSLENQLSPPGNGEESILRGVTLYNAVLSSWGVLDYDRVFLMTDKNINGRYAFSTNDFLPAINANSDNAETAAGFIQFLLSEEMQSSLELRGIIPVNKRASAEIATLDWEQLKNQGSEIELPLNFDLHRQIEQFNELVSRLNFTQVSDVASHEFIAEGIIKYFNGDYTAEETAKNLQAKLLIYLQE